MKNLYALAFVAVFMMGCAYVVDRSPRYPIYTSPDYVSDLWHDQRRRFQK